MQAERTNSNSQLPNRNPEFPLVSASPEEVRKAKYYEAHPFLEVMYLAGIFYHLSRSPRNNSKKHSQYNHHH